MHVVLRAELALWIAKILKRSKLHLLNFILQKIVTPPAGRGSVGHPKHFLNFSAISLGVKFPDFIRFDGLFCFCYTFSYVGDQVAAYWKEAPAELSARCGA